MPTIACVSDTHDQHKSIEVPDADILVHAGDITMNGTPSKLMDFNDWLGEQPHKYKIVIAGNHDFYLEKHPECGQEILSNCIYLNDSGCEVMGLKFWGSPVQPWFFDWAFNRQRGDDIKKHWDLIPNDTDVLITHGPPYGILDDTFRSGPLGCKDLLDAVGRVKPKLHVFGHIHPPRGVKIFNGTTFVNAAALDDDYNPWNIPAEIVEIDAIH